MRSTSFVGDGSGITDLDADNITAGTILDSLLSSNVSLLDTAQTFTAEKTFGTGLVLGNSTSTATGAIRFNGID